MAVRRRPRLVSRDPSVAEIMLSAGSPAEAIPAATAVRAAHALMPQATRVQARPSAEPQPAPTLPSPSPEVIIAAIARAIDAATTRSTEATAQAILKALASKTSTTAETVSTISALAAKAVETGVQKGLEASGAKLAELFSEAIGKTLYARFTRPPGPSTIRTYFLPWIGDPDSESVRVATAGNRPYEVVVRTVAPPGAFGIFSFDANELNIIDVPVVAPGITGPPTGGDLLIIPGGQFQVVRLRPNEALFAKGNIGPGAAIGPPGVVISVTGGDFTAGLTISGTLPGALVAG